MKNPAPTWLTHEIVCTLPGFFGLTRKGCRTPGLVAASSDELVTHSRKPPPILTVQDTRLWGLGLANLGNDPSGRRRAVAGSVTPSASSSAPSSLRPVGSDPAGGGLWPKSRPRSGAPGTRAIARVRCAHVRRPP